MFKQTDNDEIEIDLLKLFNAYLKRIWLIIIISILFGALAGAGSYYLIAPKYQSNVLVYVNNNTLSNGSTTQLTSGDITVSKSLVDTYSVILKSRSTLAEIKKNCNLDYTLEALNEMIVCSAVDKTELFRITVTSTDQDEAQKIAEAMTILLRDKISGVVEGSILRIIDYADASYKKTSPNNVKNAILGAMIGMLLTVAIITLKELSDTVIHDEEFLAENYDMPILSVIPDLSASDTGKVY